VSSDPLARVLAAWSAHDAQPPTLGARAGGRVELLGNHTDYNGGLVLAAAIDRHTVVIGRPDATMELRVVALDCKEDEEPTDLIPIAALHASESTPVQDLPHGTAGLWTRYVRGVLWSLQLAYGPLRQGGILLIAGNIPQGAGLSSSASLQASLALALLTIGFESGPDPRSLSDNDRKQLARWLRRSENQFVGVASGILDQMTVLMGAPAQAVLLDCADEQCWRVSLGQPAPAIVVCDSRTSRELAEGMYNHRKAECDAIAEWFRAQGKLKAEEPLSAIDLADLEAAWQSLDPIARRRARHVLTENERVRLGSRALMRGDVASLGKLMIESQESSRADFENSSKHLDALVEAAKAAPGFIGAKLSGAGWAGCTVNLVEPAATEAFSNAVRSRYMAETGLDPHIWVCHAAAGAELLPGPFVPSI
jgi:galactokinase